MSDQPEPIFIGAKYRLHDERVVVPIQYHCDVERPLGWLCWPADKPRYERVFLLTSDLTGRRIA